MKKLSTRITKLLCIGGCLIISLTGCTQAPSTTQNNNQDSSKADDITYQSQKELREKIKPNGNSQEAEQEKSSSSTEANTSGIDNEIGFRSKIFDDSMQLTDGQKKVQQYFNTDYFWVDDSEYEFLKRYPDVFQKTRIKLSGCIEKIISTNGNQYEMLVWVGPNQETLYRSYGADFDYVYQNLKAETSQNLVVIKGEYETARWIEGDEIAFIGTYKDIQSFEVGTSIYNVPVIEVYNVYIDDLFDSPILYEADFIKEVAQNIFGEEITITMGDPDADFDDYYRNHQDYWKQILNGWYYTCELDNQSNAKFSKYYFFSQYGILMDAKSTDKVQRQIEFAPDFNHFFLLIADNQLNTLTLEYYDKDLNKIWKQEYNETISAAYDYTSTHVYVVVNNELHIIDIATGEEAIKPSFIGNKSYMRKLKDGILLIDDTSSADSIMKTDLEGNIIWKINTSGTIGSANIQITDDKIILSLYIEGDGSHYMLIDNATGKVLTDAVSLTN